MCGARTVFGLCVREVDTQTFVRGEFVFGTHFAIYLVS